jgi:hypothetical protein
MKIHCSACGASLSQGTTFCPACALPLTAIAMPTPAPLRRRTPIWPYVAAAFGIICLVAYIGGNRNDAQAAAVVSAFTADLQAGKLNTPAAFQARCGNADWTEHKGTTVVLGYQRLDIHVRFPQQKPVEFGQVFAVETAPGTFKNAERRLSEESVFEDLQCKAAQ